MAVNHEDLDGGVRVLTLDHPPANAFDTELLMDLQAACEAAGRAEQVRAVVVKGAGRFFSGGLDLKHVTSTSVDEIFGASFGRNDGVFALWTLPKPTIAMINGHAIAGGCIACLACDLRIAAGGSTKIGLNEVAIGLAFPTGAYHIAVSAVGEPQARRIMLEAGVYEADLARELGLVHEIVEPRDLERVCLERARLLGAYGRAAYAHTKRELQREAVQRVVNETADQRRDTTEIWTSVETAQLLAQQFSRLAKKS